MKIAISALGKGLDAKIDPRFGRCDYFVIVEVENGDIKGVENIDNDAAESSRGAGIRAAQIVANTGVNIVISGNMGPNAFDALSKAGIDVFTAQVGISVEDAVKKCIGDELEAMLSSNRGVGHGMRKGRGRR